MKIVDRVSFRKVGKKGYIVNIHSVKDEGKPEAKWWDDEEIFLDKTKMMEFINKTAKKFKKSGGFVVFTQDWHPKNHLSFASNHPGRTPGDEFTSEDGAIGTVFWPDHCVQNTKGAEFHKDIKINLGDKIIKKGINPNVDSYSGFQDNDKKSETDLREYLNSVKIKRIFICGLALDYCCYFTAMDGVDFWYYFYLLFDF